MRFSSERLRGASSDMSRPTRAGGAPPAGALAGGAPPAGALDGAPDEDAPDDDAPDDDAPGGRWTGSRLTWWGGAPVGGGPNRGRGPSLLAAGKAAAGWGREAADGCSPVRPHPMPTGLSPALPTTPPATGRAAPEAPALRASCFSWEA